SERARHRAVGVRPRDRGRRGRRLERVARGLRSVSERRRLIAESRLRSQPGTTLRVRVLGFRAMKIYTKTGDDGSTGLFGGERVSKDDARVEAYGTVDETNGVLGSARALGLPEHVDATVAEIQKDLFTIGAELACVPGKEDKLG